jgi:hypothetical protein
MTLNRVEGGAIASNGILSIVNTTFAGNTVSTNVGSSSGRAVMIGSRASKTVSALSWPETNLVIAMGFLPPAMT